MISCLSFAPAEGDPDLIDLFWVINRDDRVATFT
jgi:hypothetical protein